uniref:carboxy-terminal kinesin 2-like n=1 Tax=Myxine glutinosa TaxID=7769 RepID=UPI0035902787
MAENQPPLGDERTPVPLSTKSRLPVPRVQHKRKLMEDAESIVHVENTKRPRLEKPDASGLSEKPDGVKARGVAVTKPIFHVSAKSASSVVRKPMVTVSPKCDATFDDICIGYGDYVYHKCSSPTTVFDGYDTGPSAEYTLHIRSFVLFFWSEGRQTTIKLCIMNLNWMQNVVVPEMLKLVAIRASATSRLFGIGKNCVALCKLRHEPDFKSKLKCFPVNFDFLLSDTAARGTRRPGWDLRGKLEDQDKALRNCEDRIAFLEDQKCHLEREADNERLLQQNELLRLQPFEVECGELQHSVAELTTAKSSLTQQKDECLQCSLKNIQLEEVVDKLKKENAEQAESKSSLTVQLHQQKDEFLQCSLKNIQLEELVDKLKKEVAAQAEKIHSQEMERRRLHNIVEELKGNIRVFCRVRPFMRSEENSFEHIELTGNSITLEKTTESRTGRDKKEATRFSFTFDQVFSPSAKQSAVFEEISHLVQSALDGYNVTIFAYGQTGGGKTYTMEGPTKGPAARKPESRGIIPRAVSQVFSTAEQLQVQGWKYTFVASFLEIYNDTIQDLLVSGASRHDYEIKHKPKSSRSHEFYVTNLRYEPVTSEEEVEMLLRKASENRSVAATAVNDRSSRSHSIFQLHIEGSNECTGQACFAILTLVDLAGSERLNKSQSCGERLKEAQAINLSLSCLAQVITALGHKDQHVPFRNSKLTYLLQDCLAGNSKTLMFVNLNPSYKDLNETLNSLRFAAMVNNCVFGTAQASRK